MDCSLLSPLSAYLDASPRLCKSLIETSLFKPGLVEQFDTQGVWPAGMILASVGSVNVKDESFSKVRKAVQVQ